LKGLKARKIIAQGKASLRATPFCKKVQILLAHFTSPPLQQMRMAQHGESGRIVVDVEPKLKRRIYSALSLSGGTLKDWFIKAAEELCEEHRKPIPVSNVRYGRSAKAASAALKEDYQPVVATAEASSNGNGNGNGKVVKKYTVVSMFSGCGGMDLGFAGGFEIFGRRYRSLPFEIVWANDISPEACKTYERNLGQPQCR
jgi:hypothetical protein